MITDEQKLYNIIKEVSNKNEVFTSEMVYDYIFNRSIKFRKNMSTKKIGYYISTSGKFDKFKTKNRTHYTLKKGVEL